MSTTQFTARPPKVRFVLREEPPIFGEKPLLDTPEKLYEFYRHTISTDGSFEAGKENLIVIALDTRLRIIGYNIVSVGSVSQTTAHPREIFRPVIALGAYAFAVMHNHPSQDPSPSRADEQVTRRLVEASGIMQITFLDHVVCGSPAPGRAGYYSFREAGMIP